MRANNWQPFRSLRCLSADSPRPRIANQSERAILYKCLSIYTNSDCELYWMKHYSAHQNKYVLLKGKENSKGLQHQKTLPTLLVTMQLF